MKVLIVDDEQYMSEWLEFCIKEIPNVSIVGVAKNGKEALRLLGEKSVDLVITDIRMPVMDGIQLLKEVKKLYPYMYCLLLTAHSEFEYAREGIRSGADDYIIKTEMSKEKLKEMLNTYALKLAKESQKSHHTKNTSHVLYYPVVNKIFNSSELICDNQIDQLKSIHFATNFQNIISVCFRSNEMKSVVEISKKIKDKYTVFYEYELNNESYVILISFGNVFSEMDILQNINNIKNIIRSGSNVAYAMNSTSHDFREIPLAIEESRINLAYQFYHTEKLSYNKESYGNLQEFKRLDLLKDFEIQRRFQNIITTRSQNRASLVRELYLTMEELKTTNILLLKKTSKDIIALIYSTSVNENISFALNEVEELKKNIDNTSNFLELSKLVKIYFDQFDKTWSKELSIPISKAIEYMKKNYHEQISLDIVADVVGLNSEYLSRTFKKEVKISYSAYLTSLRMTMAEELLKSTTEQIQEIASKVGYYNVSYFSTLFKKEYGMNPHEYRKQNFQSQI